MSGSSFVCCMSKLNNIEVCFSPALAQFIRIRENALVVVVDILRATTSIVSALTHGAKAVIPVATLDGAKELKAKGFPVAAERDGKVLDFADFGNSAFDFMDGQVRNRKLVFSTTNGTVAIETAKKHGEVALGAFSNISALANWISSQKKNIIILCSGWKNTFCLEDTIYAGALIEKLMERNPYKIHCDSAAASSDLWKIARPDPKLYADKAIHRERLRKLGVDDVLEFSYRMDTSEVVPVLRGDEIVDISKFGA